MGWHERQRQDEWKKPYVDAVLHRREVDPCLLRQLHKTLDINLEAFDGQESGYDNNISYKDNSYKN